MFAAQRNIFMQKSYFFAQQGFQVLALTLRQFELLEFSQGLAKSRGAFKQGLGFASTTVDHNRFP